MSQKERDALSRALYAWRMKLQSRYNIDMVEWSDLWDRHHNIVVYTKPHHATEGLP